MLLTPTQMLINAIELMYYFTQFPLDSFIDATIIMSGPRFTTEIAVDISPGPGRLLLSFAVQALYQMSVRMAQEKRYFLQWGRIVLRETKGGVISKETQRGILRFQQISPSLGNDLIAGSELRGDRNSSNGSASGYDAFLGDFLTQGNYSTNADDEGQIFDFKDKKLVVYFKFDKTLMKAQEVFTSFLDGLAIATEHDQAEVGASINTYSASLESTLHVHHLDSPRYYRRGLNWGMMARVLIIVWEQLIMGNSPGRRGQLPRYEGMEFEIWYDRVKIGIGELWSVGVQRPGFSISK